MADFSHFELRAVFPEPGNVVAGVGIELIPAAPASSPLSAPVPGWGTASGTVARPARTSNDVVISLREMSAPALAARSTIKLLVRLFEFVRQLGHSPGLPCGPAPATQA